MYRTKQQSINGELSGTARPGRARPVAWGALILLCLAQLMVTIDGTVVNVALPTISRALGFGPGQVQWVVTGYLLCTGGLVLLAGRAADRFGRRRTLLTGAAVFTGASLASALAPDAAALIASRAVQGAGAALLSPAALAIITTTYTGSRRAKALAAWGAIAAGGFVAGLLVGGALTTWAGWRWIFFINLPVGAVALVGVRLLVPPDRGDRPPAPALPVARAVALTAGLAAVIYALGAPHGWGSPATVTGFAAGAALIAGFVVADRRAAARVLPPRPAGTRSLPTGAALMLGATGLLAGTLFVTTFFLQQQLHSSALRTGLDYLPFALAIGLAAHMGPHLLTRFGSRVVGTGALLSIAAGAVLLAAAPDGARYATSLLPAFLILGIGTGLALTSASVTAMADVASDHAGAASGLLTTGHELGGAIGIAVFSAIAIAAGRGGAAAGAVQIAAGHHVASIATAAVAAGLAVLTAAAMPNVRPPAGACTGLH
jgi:EmrB/QacA subfamily drug resistance transporter